MPHIGDNWSTEQPIRINYDEINGNTWERTWKGRYEAMLFGLESFRRGALATQYTQEGNVGTIVSRFGNFPLDGNSERPIDTFDIEPEEISQSIYKHPTFTVLSSNVVKKIQEELTTSTNADASILEVKRIASLDNGSTNIYEDIAATAYIHQLHGDDQYLLTQSYSLTRTRTVSRLYQLQVAYAQDNVLYSTAFLAGYLGNVLPWAIPQLTVAQETRALRLVFAWRKRGTKVISLPNGNVQMQEQWQSGRWSANLYTIGA